MARSNAPFIIFFPARKKQGQEPAVPLIDQEARPSLRLSPTLSKRLTDYDPARDLRCRL